MFVKIAFLSVAAALAVLGCAGQDPAKYRKVLTGPTSVVTPSTCPGQTLTLEEAMAMANAHNERLSISGEDYVQALIEKDRAIWNFLPQVALQPNYFVMDAVHFPPAQAAFREFLPQHAFDLPLNVRSNLFNGFRDVEAVEKAASFTEQRKALLLDMQSMILVEVAQVYYQVLRQEKLAEVLTESAQVQENRVTDLENKLKAGTVRAVDVSQARAQAANTRSQLLAARADAQKGRFVLAFVTGAFEINSHLVDEFEVPPLPPVEQLAALGEGQRQDLAAAAAGIGAAKYNVQQALGQYAPSVTLNLSTYLYRESFPSTSEWNTLLTVNIPLFSAGQIEANVRTAWSQLRQACLRERLIRRQILQDVRVAYENVLLAQNTLVELRTQVQAAEDAYRQAGEAFRAGVATSLEQLIAQDQLLNAQVQLNSQEFNYKAAYLSLLRVSGQLMMQANKVKAVDAATSRPASQSATQAAAKLVRQGAK